MNACNQKSNREPVMNLDEDAVREAIRGLEKDGRPARRTTSIAESRNTSIACRKRLTSTVAKRLCSAPCCCVVHKLRASCVRAQSACILSMILSEVESALQRLMQRTPPLVKVLPRQPGTKEARYVNLLSGDVEVGSAVSSAPPSESQRAVGSRDTDRMAQLEQEVIELKSEIEELKRQFADFRKQFE